MPHETAAIPPGTLHMLILKTLQPGPLHGYAIAQRIHLISDDVLQVEEGSLYPALQRMLINGWVTADWSQSETGRRVRLYKLTTAGRKQLGAEISEFDRVMKAVYKVIEAPDGQIVAQADISAQATAVGAGSR